MKPKVRALRSLIYNSYDSESQFAEHIGWSRQRLSRITNGKKEPSVSEVNEIAVGLDASVESIAQIFLHVKSPNEQLNINNS